MPALSAEALAEKLAKGKPPAAILLLGTEVYLREASRQRIIEASTDPGARDWAVARFSADEDGCEPALAQARTMPLLARRQVVILSDVQAIEGLPEKHRDAATDNLAAYLRDPAPFTVLVLEAGSLDQRMKLARILHEQTVVIAAELPDDPRERARLASTVARQMARELKSEMDAEAAEELCELCNANLDSMRTEVAKLATYVGPGQRISPKDVEALVVSEKRYSVWELADVLASAQRPRAFAFLASVLQSGEPAPAVLGAMAWMYRKLLDVQALGPNATGYQAASRLQMRVNTAELALRQAKRIPRRQLVEGMRALYDADSRLKSGSGNDRAIMEFLIARLMPAAPRSNA